MPSLYDKSQLAGIFTLTAIVQERVKAAAQLVWLGGRPALKQGLPKLLTLDADLLQP